MLRFLKLTGLKIPREETSMLFSLMWQDIRTSSHRAKEELGSAVRRIVHTNGTGVLAILEAGGTYPRHVDSGKLHFQEKFMGHLENQSCLKFLLLPLELATCWIPAQNVDSASVLQALGKACGGYSPSCVWLLRPHCLRWDILFMSMGLSRQEYRSGLPFPSPGDLPNPGIKPRSPALQVDSLLTELPGNSLPRTVFLKPPFSSWCTMSTWQNVVPLHENMCEWKKRNYLRNAKALLLPVTFEQFFLLPVFTADNSCMSSSLFTLRAIVWEPGFLRNSSL